MALLKMINCILDRRNIKKSYGFNTSRKLANIAKVNAKIIIFTLTFRQWNVSSVIIYLVRKLHTQGEWRRCRTYTVSTGILDC